MLSDYITLFFAESQLFDEQFIEKHQCIFFFNYDIFFNFSYFLDLSRNFYLLNSLDFSNNESAFSYLVNSENTEFFTNLEAVQTVYHYSIPNVKLFYPEPFIAAPSFMHTDLWFVHILVYQYWLWFVFIFIIVFFLVTFLSVVRWCNLRTKPRRETRGVSRSKCGDLITAIVPVSWAASIIISESTDAIDYFDGFGTTEMVVGIRAFQWGWEYYYPKDLDLNYNIKKNYSTLTGNSLKYNKTPASNLHSNSVWKFYQNKMYDSTVTPAHLILLPIDNYKILNFLNFSDVGTNAFHESSLFKHTRAASKVFNANLLFSPSNFVLKYRQASLLFFNDLTCFDSYSYGLKRQHNFLSSKSLNNNFSTLFNLKSAEKFLNFNYNAVVSLNKTFTGTFLINLFKPANPKTSNVPFMFFEAFKTSPHLQKLHLFATYPSLLEKLNNNTDKKKIKNPALKLFFSPLKKQKLLSLCNFINKIPQDNQILTNTVTINSLFKNNRLTHKNINIFSSNEAISRLNQTVKHMTKISPTAGNFNMSFYLNNLNFWWSYAPKHSSISHNLLINSKRANWVDTSLMNKLISNRFYAETPAPAFISNDPSSSLLNYDNYKFDDVVATGLNEREDLSYNAISKIYWNMLWAHTDVNWRLQNILTYNNLHNAFYFPVFTFGYDYDFRNWQSLSLLEDAYWESINSAYYADEYSFFLRDFNKQIFFQKHKYAYNYEDRLELSKNKILNKPLFTNLHSIGYAYSNALYSDEPAPEISTSITHTLSAFNTFANVNLMEESFEFLKNLNHFSTNLSFFFLKNTNFFNAFEFTFVYDTFRADAEDFYLFSEEGSKIDDDFFFPAEKTFLTFIFDFWNFNFNGWFYKSLFCSMTADIYSKQLLPFEVSADLECDNDFFAFSPALRFSNYFLLRPSTRSAMSNYSSYQKVYKARFDENRSFAKITDIAHSFVKQTNVSTSRIRYERLLGKNKENFLQPKSFKNELLTSFNSLYDVFTSLNFYFFDFPFLLAMKSDASRYFWFDWFSRWGSCEVQPSSASRYSISGVPYFNKGFDFNPAINIALTDTENYFVRIARARKNYLPSWVFTPYFYASNISWYKDNFIFDILLYNVKSLRRSYFFLDGMSWYWKNLFFINASCYLFTPHNSNINSYARSNWHPASLVAAYYCNTTTLLDILTKREHLYRQFLLQKKKIISLPLSLTSHPSNPLIGDIKAAFLLSNPASFNNEYSRHIYYKTLTNFNFTLLDPTLKSIVADTAILLFFQKSMNFLPFNTSRLNLVEKNELVRSQYRPMRRGITNMIRLHGTGAVAMPIEIRLQVLASSKDVIHSWAIPSAGVKIDCVPGYSSHRVLIFLVSGIFWGQCMEVCGRYHHWMPIIVYFMKRDLFFLWCTHFVFASGSSNMWNINDRQFTNYVRLASFNKANWLLEIKK